MMFCSVIVFHYHSLLYISIPRKTVRNWHQMLSGQLLLSCRLCMLFVYNAIWVRLALLLLCVFLLSHFVFMKLMIK